MYTTLPGLLVGSTSVSQASRQARVHLSVQGAGSVVHSTLPGLLVGSTRVTQAGRQTDEQADRWMDGQIGRQMDGWADRQTDGRMGRQIDE